MALDITSYEIGKKAGGGSQPVNLQDKEITITENGEQTITADSGYDGLSSVEVTTNVSAGGDYNTTLDVTKFMRGSFAGTFQRMVTKIDTSNFDTSDLTNMQGMFQGCVNLTELDLSSFDTSNVNNMSGMFSDGYAEMKLTELDLSSFNTSNVTNMSSMFSGCSLLTSINFGNNFNTSKVTNMNSMFQNCNSFTNLDVSNFDTSNVNNMGRIFSSCGNLVTINFGNNFNTSKVTNMQYMFASCTKLDNDTLNAILGLCIGATSYAGAKTLATLGITSSFTNFANIPNLSNYQAFLDAGWTIS